MHSGASAALRTQTVAAHCIGASILLMSWHFTSPASAPAFGLVHRDARHCGQREGEPGPGIESTPQCRGAAKPNHLNPPQSQCLVFPFWWHPPCRLHEIDTPSLSGVSGLGQQGGKEHPSIRCRMGGFQGPIGYTVSVGAVPKAGTAALSLAASFLHPVAAAATRSPPPAPVAADQDTPGDTPCAAAWRGRW